MFTVSTWKKNMTEDAKNKTYHHHDLRQALISAGLELLVAEGMTGIDLRKVARKVGVSHAAPYRHFADKEDLLAAISVEGFERLNQHLRGIADQSGASFEHQLLAFTRAYIEFALKNAALIQALLGGLFVRAQKYPLLFEAIQVPVTLLEQMLKRGQDEGVFIDEPASQLANVFLQGVNGLAMHMLKQYDTYSLEAQVSVEHETALMVRLIYYGLKRSDHR
jgi:AcrR family transcriptional regulator